MDPSIEPVEYSTIVCVAVEAEKQIGFGTKHDCSYTCVGSGDCKAEDNITNEIEQASEIADAISLHAGGTVDQESKIYGCSACCWNRQKVIW